MALNATRLRQAIVARVRGLYRTESTEDQDRDPDYFLNQYFQIVSEELVSEIQTYARCIGADSAGDSHGNVQIE